MKPPLHQNYETEHPRLGAYGEEEMEDDNASIVEDMAIEDDDEMMGSNETNFRGRNFTLKRLVRLLHIDKPVFHVMAILGKRLVFYIHME